MFRLGWQSTATPLYSHPQQVRNASARNSKAVWAACNSNHMCVLFWLSGVPVDSATLQHRPAAAPFLLRYHVTSRRHNGRLDLSPAFWRWEPYLLSACREQHSVGSRPARVLAAALAAALRLAVAGCSDMLRRCYAPCKEGFDHCNSHPCNSHVEASWRAVVLPLPQTEQPTWVVKTCRGFAQDAITNEVNSVRASRFVLIWLQAARDCQTFIGG